MNFGTQLKKRAPLPVTVTLCSFRNMTTVQGAKTPALYEVCRPSRYSTPGVLERVPCSALELCTVGHPSVDRHHHHHMRVLVSHELACFY